MRLSFIDATITTSCKVTKFHVDSTEMLTTFTKCCNDLFYGLFTNLSLPNTHVHWRVTFFSCLYIKESFSIKFYKTITGNDRSFSRPIIYTGTLHYANLFTSTSTMLDTINSFSNWELYLAIIASIALKNINLLPTFPVTNLAPLISTKLNV